MPLFIDYCALLNSLSDSMLAELSDPNIEKMFLYFAQAVAALCCKLLKSPNLQASSELMHQLGACCSQCLLRSPVLVKVQAAVNDNTNKQKLMMYLFETVFMWTMTAESSNIDTAEYIAALRGQLFVSLLHHPRATVLSRIIELVCF
jgi:hypothetical protein